MTSAQGAAALPVKLHVCCLHLMYLKNGIHRKNRTYPRAFGEPVASLGTLADVEMVAYAGAAPATPE